ncbi:putative lipid II flippase FtsW [Candidatus Acetothermia bacterium]|nr:putative lipid II flippase FtsW [Candidatus Acetothermia bacterium]
MVIGSHGPIADSQDRVTGKLKLGGSPHAHQPGANLRARWSHLSGGARLRPRAFMGDRVSAEAGLSLTIAVLVLFGLIMVASSSFATAQVLYGQPQYFLLKQLFAAVIGFIALTICRSIDYRRWANTDMLLLAGTIGLTVLTFIPALAPDRQWLKLGPIALQPTEFVKFALVVYVASFLMRKDQYIESFREGLLPPLIILGFAAGLAALQPDFGMLMVFSTIVLFMLFLGGARLWHLSSILLATVPVVFVLTISAPYRLGRLMAFLDPFKYSTSEGYQLIQSLVAIGSGGLLGRGFTEGYQKLLYLPQSYNDFIFSIIGEELGLWGTLLVIGLFAYLAYLGMQIALRAPDRFGMYLSAGITFSLVLQAVINMGVATGIMPVTGLTLPFISYGGSSLILSMGMAGVLLNIAKQSEGRPARLGEKSSRRRLAALER